MESTVAAVASLVPSGAERRLGIRVNQCFKVEFRVLNDSAALGAYTAIEARNYELGNPAPSDRIPAQGEDLSYGGLGISGDLDLLAETRIQVGSFLDMELEIHGAGPLRCVGSVSWLREEPAKNSFRCGVSFLCIDQEDLSLVSGVILRAAAPWRWA
jgi:hypothetical protein